jgi:hypothetical protein
LIESRRLATTFLAYARAASGSTACRVETRVLSMGLAGTEVGRTFIDDYNTTTGSAHYGAAHASRVPLFVRTHSF